MESATHHHQHNHIHDQHNLQAHHFPREKRNSNVYVRISSSRGFHPALRPASIKHNIHKAHAQPQEISQFGGLSVYS